MKTIILTLSFFTFFIFYPFLIYSQFTGPTSGVMNYSNNFNGGTRVIVSNTDNSSNSWADILVTTGPGKAFGIQKFGSNFSSLDELNYMGLNIADMARFRSDSGVKGLIFTTGSNWPLIFGTSDQERMRISGSGNVGIGTSNPGAKLSVNGRIESTEVQVKATIADYVFADDYYLMSLEEIEQFIIENKHLPNMYSEKNQIENNGNIPLGQVTMSLLEKIEELTLHIIQLNRRIKELEKK